MPCLVTKAETCPLNMWARISLRNEAGHVKSPQIPAAREVRSQESNDPHVARDSSGAIEQFWPDHALSDAA